jgi:hypothetical protein
VIEVALCPAAPRCPPNRRDQVDRRPLLQRRLAPGVAEVRSDDLARIGVDAARDSGVAAAGGLEDYVVHLAAVAGQARRLGVLLLLLGRCVVVVLLLSRCVLLLVLSRCMVLLLLLLLLLLLSHQGDRRRRRR